MCVGDKEQEQEQPQIQYSQSPEYAKQMELFNKYQEPYMASQYSLYSDVYEPTVRSLGGILGEQLSNPLQLPEETWANIRQKGITNIGSQYDKTRQSATERAAGSGMLGQGPTEKYMQSLDLSQAKSTEDYAIDMAIAEWNEKKTAKQQAIQNSMGYLTGQPSFNLNMPSSTPYTVAPQQQTDWLGNIAGLMEGTGEIMSGLGSMSKGKGGGNSGTSNYSSWNSGLPTGTSGSGLNYDWSGG